MKKITGAILMATLVMIILAALTSCRTRKVAIQKKDSTTVHQSDVRTTTAATHIDTGRITGTKTETKATSITLVDSSGTKTTIVPEAGSTVTVAADGSFTGKAASVITERHDRKKINRGSTGSTQEAQTVKKGISDSLAASTAATKRDSTHITSQSKTVDAKQSYGPWPYVIGIVIIVIIIIALFWFFGKPKTS